MTPAIVRVAIARDYVPESMETDSCCTHYGDALAKSVTSSVGAVFNLDKCSDTMISSVCSGGRRGGRTIHTVRAAVMEMG